MALTTQQNPWGTAGNPYAGGDSDAARDFLNAIIGGQQYRRIGPVDQIVAGTNPQADLMKANATYDPQYGWVIPQGVYDQANQQHIAQNVKADFMDNAPLAAMLAGGGLAAYSALAGGAAGAGTGAGEMFGLTGMEGAAGGLGGGAGAGATGALSTGLEGLGGASYGAGVTPSFGATGVGTGLETVAGAGIGGAGPVVGSVDALTQAAMAGAGGAGAATTAAAASPGLWSRVLAGTATADDWAKIAGNVGSTALGVYGASQQADALRDINSQQNAIAQQYMQMGAPYRDLLAKSYDPSFDLFAQPGYAGAFDKVADLSTRAWSGRGVNPANNPGAQTEIQRDVFAGAYLPALANYRGGLGQFGGLGLNQSGSMFQGAIAPQMAATGADRSITQTLAGTLGELTKPANPYEDFVNKLRLSIGGMPA